MNMKHRERLKLSFSVISSVSAILWCFSVSTYTIEGLEVGILTFFFEVPWEYWIGLALLYTATLIWWIARQTERVHFQLVILWTMYLFIGPLLLERYVRINDTYDFLYLVNYVEGKLSYSSYINYPEALYTTFPGFLYMATFLHLTAGIGYYELPKLIGVSMYLIASLASLLLAYSLLKGGSNILILTLTFLAFQWAVITHPSPSGLGQILMLFLLIFLFNPTLSRRRYNALLSTILFSSLVISHGPTSYIIISLIVFLVLLHPFADVKCESGEDRNRCRVIPFCIIFFIWLIYIAGWAFESTLKGFREAILTYFEATTFQFTRNLTVYRSLTIYLSLSFIIVVAIWLFTVILRRQFWRDVTPHKVLPLLMAMVISSTTLTIPAYLYNITERIYAFSYPFLAWFLVKESQTKIHARQQYRTLIFLLILLAISFLARYSREPVIIFSHSEVIGAKYLCENTPPTSIVYYDATTPWPPAMSDLPCQLFMQKGVHARVFEVENILKGVNEAKLIVNSVSVRNKLLYFFGDDVRDLFTTFIDANRSDLLYSNGDFSIYDGNG
jgi:hypothetical protein